MDRIRILAVFLLPLVRRSAGREGEREEGEGERQTTSILFRPTRTDGGRERKRGREREAAAREKRERAQVNERMASLPPSPCLFVLHLASKNSLRSPAASPSLPPSPIAILLPNYRPPFTSSCPSLCPPRGLCKLLPLLLRREPESEGK